VPLDGLHIVIREAGFPADGGQQSAELDAALGFDGFLQDVAYLCLGASAVLGRTHAQRPMGFFRQVPYCQRGHRCT
jgi:hypothetical protein